MILAAHPADHPCSGPRCLQLPCTGRRAARDQADYLAAELGRLVAESGKRRLVAVAEGRVEQALMRDVRRLEHACAVRFRLVIEVACALPCAS
jgi:hypothetical protein